MDLDKALRAMNYSEAWRNSVQAAALFENREFTQELLAAMTKKFLDRLEMSSSFTIIVPNSLGDDLLEAVEEYEPEEIEPSQLEQLTNQINSLNRQLLSQNEELATIKADLSTTNNSIQDLNSTLSQISVEEEETPSIPGIGGVGKLGSLN